MIFASDKGLILSKNVDMKKFSQIYDLAVLRKGSEQDLLSILPVIKTSELVLAQSDDRLLSMMSKCIFQAGFSWKVVDKKWPEFEVVFHNFDPLKMELLSDEDLERLVKDARIIRNMQKIKTVPKNAQWMNEISERQGSFSRFLFDWPCEDFTGLLKLLKKRGERLGGNTGQRFLRLAGIDGFILTRDVILGLQNGGLEISDVVTSKHDLQLVQAAFNHWHQETGLPFSHMSKILAYSAGDNYDVEFLREQMH